GGDGPPAPSSAPVVDIGTGALAALGILAAVYARGSDGRGRHVRTSLAAGAVFIQSAELTRYPSRSPANRGGPDFLGSDPFVRYYATRDGWLAVAARTKELQDAVCAVCEVSPAEVGRLEEVFQRADAADWVDRLSLLGVPAASVLRRDA